jgi:Putative amidoligase enzyme
MGVPMIRSGKLPLLGFTYPRRFGIELELNAFDGKNRPDTGSKPAGIDYIAMLVAKSCGGDGVDIRDWQHTDGNDGWVVKPDSSCGLEVCTPIFKGWDGLRKVCEVVHAFQLDPKIKVDNRCSVHIHIEVADLSQDQLGSIIAHWFKVEPVFMDSVPPHRKRNRYCQFMGLTNLVQHDARIVPSDIVRRVGNVKYYSLNTNQMIKNGRQTVEFRIIEGDGVKDPYLIKNWTRLIIQFVERASKLAYPGNYQIGNPWTSFCWLDPIDVFDMLGFNPEQYELSPGLQQTRDWFLARLQKHMAKDTEGGPRSIAYKQLQELIAKFNDYGINTNPADHLSPSDMRHALFCEEAKV